MEFGSLVVSAQRLDDAWVAERSWDRNPPTTFSKKSLTSKFSLRAIINTPSWDSQFKSTPHKGHPQIPSK